MTTTAMPAGEAGPQRDDFGPNERFNATELTLCRIRAEYSEMLASVNAWQRSWHSFHVLPVSIPEGLQKHMLFGPRTQVATKNQQ